MRQTNYKVDKIKAFIIANRPTRSQLIKYIAVNLNGTDEVYFDENSRKFRGYYATNISTMRKAENISTKDKRYFVTKQGMTNEKSLYYKPDLVMLREQVIDLKRKVLRQKMIIDKLRDEGDEMQIEIKQYECTMKHINMLSQKE